MNPLSRGIFFAMIGMFLYMSGCAKQPEIADQRALLLQTDREFSAYSALHGAAEAFKEYLVEDALQLPAGEAPIHGRDSIYEAMSKNSGSYTLSWEPQDGAVAASGDMAYTWGVYTVKVPNQDGSETTSQGKYLNVWRKTVDGQWRVLIDMGNQNPPAE